MTFDVQSTVRDTSFDSYAKLRPSLGYEQQLVYDYLYEQRMMGLRPPTDREIALGMGRVDPNSIRPRRRELVKMGWVVECPKRKCTVTNVLAYTWAVNDLALQFRTKEDL